MIVNKLLQLSIISWRFQVFQSNSTFHHKQIDEFIEHSIKKCFSNVMNMMVDFDAIYLFKDGLKESLITEENENVLLHSNLTWGKFSWLIARCELFMFYTRLKNWRCHLWLQKISLFQNQPPLRCSKHLERLQ